MTSITASSFARRAVTTAVVLPLALWLIYMGDWFYFIPIVLIVTLATIEYATLLATLNWKLPLWILLPAVLAQLVAGAWPNLNLFAPLLVFSLAAAMVYVLWQYETRRFNNVPATWVGTMAGIVLLGWLGGHFFRLRLIDSDPLGWQWVMLVMLGTWIADSAAYLFGSQFGRRQLAPRLSPNKTVEGYFAGILFGPLSTLVMASLFGLPAFVALILGLVVSIVSPAGDLAISLLKREAGVKDSGQMLPGHGGALDRIDSLLWSVSIAYYVIVFLT
ncbi:MAG: phosphatidate cytidylyltransferase [Candidatus Promineifilaceae bacterium]|nr:phosphatidate cytidylyltransferase [Candidatus Promineifilaceae bacterium]